MANPKLHFLVIALMVFSATISLAQESNAKLKALIVDGQNNHKIWPKTTKMMKQYLESTNRFTVDVATTKPSGTDPTFAPVFSNYDVVVSNFGHGAAPWPEATQKSFVEYMEKGGGLVVVHAADNSFPKWKAFNEMIGLGGWGGRNEKSGPYVYYKDGKEVRDTSKGNGGNHGPQHEFSIVIRDDQHPITKGLPKEFLHVKDELYQQLRGPALNMKILATAYSAPKFRGTDRHEPMIMTIDYGQGRVFHTPMGHGDYSCECVGFINVFQRGTEWAATGEVTIPVADDFPSADKVSARKFSETPVNKAGASLETRIKDMIAMLESEITANTIKEFVGDRQFDIFKKRGNMDQMVKLFADSKAPRLLEVLKSVDVSKIKMIGENEAVVELEDRPLKFFKDNGRWRIKN